MAIDKVAEDQGGMMGGHSAGSWPRDVKQAYNLKCKSKPGSTVRGTDPYLALVMQCKEEAKYKKTAYIRNVICAPEPVVILSTEEQIAWCVSVQMALTLVCSPLTQRLTLVPSV